MNVQGVLAPTFLNMAAGDGHVDARNSAPNLGGSLEAISGPVWVGSYAKPGGTLADVTLIVDNSADPTPQTAELSVSPNQHYYEAL